jgi:lipopolysaccharide export system protein LptC
MSPRRVAKMMGLCGAAVLAVVFVVTVWVVRHRSSTAVLRDAASVVPGALFHARNFKWTQMKDGQSQWRLSARDASYARDKTSLSLTDAHLAMLSDGGKDVAVTAPHAMIALTGNHVSSAHLSGGLTINYGDFVVTTAEATFMPDRDAVTAPGKVKVVGKGLTVTGVGLKGHPKERSFTLLSQTNTVVVPDKARDKKPGKS